MIRVGLIMHQPLARDALERALAASRSPEIRVTYSQSSPEIAPAYVPAFDVACVEAVNLSAIHPRWLSSAPVIALSANIRRSDLIAFLRAGGRGCLSEDILLPDLIDAIVAVQAGGYCLCPQARQALLAQPQLRLTPRQQEVARAICALSARGARVTVQALSDYLSISPKTAYAHLYQLAAVLGISAGVEEIIERVSKLQL